MLAELNSAKHFSSFLEFKNEDILIYTIMGLHTPSARNDWKAVRFLSFGFLTKKLMFENKKNGDY